MASARKRGNRWMALYDDYSGGKRSQKSAGTFGTEDDALKTAEEAEARSCPAEQPVIQPAAIRGQLTVAGYMPVFLKGHKLRDTSRENYTYMARHITDGLGDIVLRELTPADIRAFFRELEDEGELADPTIRRILIVLRGCSPNWTGRRRSSKR